MEKNEVKFFDFQNGFLGNHKWQKDMKALCAGYMYALSQAAWCLEAYVGVSQAFSVCVSE